MKLTDLPQAVLDDLCQEDQWRLDIDPGFDSKHEFWMAWHHFLRIPDESYYPKVESILLKSPLSNGSGLSQELIYRTYTRAVLGIG